MLYLDKIKISISSLKGVNSIGYIIIVFLWTPYSMSAHPELSLSENKPNPFNINS